MSTLSKTLIKLGVPKEALDGVQSIVDGLVGDTQKQLADALAKLRASWAGLLPTADALVTSIKGQAAFKQVYRNLSAEGKLAVDAALKTIVECALVKVRKAMGLGSA